MPGVVTRFKPFDLKKTCLYVENLSSSGGYACNALVMYIYKKYGQYKLVMMCMVQTNMGLNEH